MRAVAYERVRYNDEGRGGSEGIPTRAPERASRPRARYSFFESQALSVLSSIPSFSAVASFRPPSCSKAQAT